MNLEHADSDDHEARIHRPPGSLPGARRTPLRRLRHAPVFELRGHRLWPEDAKVLRQASAARVRLDLRLRAQSRTRLSRASSGDLRGDRRARQPASQTARRASRARTVDAVGRDSARTPESIWMSSSAEKVDYLSSRGISTDDAPHLIIRQGDQRRVRHFPDRLPIGVHPSGHVVFVYLHSDPMHDEFRDFLQRHAPLLERLLAWTIRIVVPAHLEGAVQDLQKAAWGQLASPLKDPILTELRWYFERFASPPTEASSAVDRARFERCHRAFATDRYASALPMLAAGWRAGAGDGFVACRREGDGVRGWENRAPGVAACLQPPGADGRRRLKASGAYRFRSRKGTASVTLARLKSSSRLAQSASPSPSSSASVRKQPTSSFSSNTTSSTAYGGPFNQLGSSSTRFVIRSSPSTLSALETSRGPSFTATTTRVPMSVQRNAPACVQNVSPITKSLSSIVGGQPLYGS